MAETLQPECPSRVLILDDDASQLESLSAILRDEGFDVVGCQSASAAVQRIGCGDVDVAVIDLRLPGANEPQLLDSLAELADDVASIIHTGHISYHSAEKAVRAGAFAYVEKGDDPAELIGEVRRAVQDRQRRHTKTAEREVAKRTIRPEEQLGHAQKMEAIGQLASRIGHEFNNLLFGILGSAELMLTAPEGAPPEHLKRPLQDIIECGERGVALTRQLREFAGKKDSDVSLFDVNQVVTGLEGELGQVAGERITLETVLDSDFLPIQANRAEIERAITNVAKNACDAMPDGGTLTIRTATEVLDTDRVSGNPHTRPDPYVRLSVTDTGSGMTPETAQRIFEPFFSTKPAGKGIGLGLSTVFADVTRGGGFIEVESRLNQGTVFRIYLPVVEEKGVATNDDADRSAEVSLDGDETILVCDDDGVVLNSSAFMLESRGYSVIRARSGRQALEAAASHAGSIELLLTDVTMSEMNGWQLAKELTGQRLDMKVIFTSGHAADVIKVGAAEGEHIEFIEKPPMGDTLFRRIREVLDAPARPAP